MAANSNIEWTDSTWNPIRGCSPVSPGCKNCYAAKTAQRFSKPGGPFEGLVRINAAGVRTDEWNGKIAFIEKRLFDPLKWGEFFIESPEVVVGQDSNGNKYVMPKNTRSMKSVEAASRAWRPRRIFVNSVSDLFHENVTDEQRDKIFGVMALAPQHRFQVLTKRPELMEVYFHTGPVARVREAMIGMQANRINQVRTGDPCMEWSGLPLPNVLLGTSVENEEWADKRALPMCHLSKLGWKTMVSYEPALGPVNWAGWGFLNWLISGGESQPGARPSHPAWHRAARDFAESMGIAFFFKQWGNWAPFTESPRDGDVAAMRLMPRNTAGHLLDGKVHQAFPEGF